ncbi:type II 3-dehydroquinate dehydratase [Candidatus Vidania fulgoroideorum]
MKKILIINGSNLNFLGIREKKFYGKYSLNFIHKKIQNIFKNKVKLYFYQSNSEKNLINKIQKSYKKIDWIIINPGGFSYFNISILDALLGTKIPYIEIHMSNIFNREKKRKKTIFAKYSFAIISGMNYYGYISAINFIYHLK